MAARVARLAILAVIASAPASALGQDQSTLIGDRLSGHVLPIEPVPGDIQLTATRAWQWTIDDTQRLLLQGDVRIKIAGYTFNAPEATVWLNRLPSQEGLINQIAVFFARVDDPTSEAGRGIAGENVLVTGSTRGEVELRAALVESQRPASSSVVAAGERRLADHLRSLSRREVSLQHRPQIDRPEAVAPRPAPQPGAAVEFAPPPHAGTASDDQSPPIFVPTGLIRFSAGHVQITPGEEENVATLTNSVMVDYQATDARPRWTQMTLSAERAVIFTDPGSMEQMAKSQLTAAAIRGIYLEGNVTVTADNGRYVARAPRVYYDLRNDQAVMVDAVLRTYSRTTHMPIYARARELRQVAADQWTGRDLRLSTSEFFRPHLAIGSRQVTVTQRPDPQDPTETATFVDARGNTLRLADVPVFYWPRLAGRVQDMPLRRVEVGYRENDGARIETAWDLPVLLGVEKPLWLDRADLKLDAFSKRGAAIGGELQYHYDAATGMIDLYGMSDSGIDRTSTGIEVDPSKEFRGIAAFEHQVKFDRNWTLQLQGALISDETFISTWRDEDFTDRREYETSAYLKYQKGNNALTLLGKYDLNDFVSNDWLLASRQRSVDKVGEVAYRRYADSLFGDRLTYSSETRIGRNRFRLTRRTPRELGVKGEAFGVGEDDQLSDVLREEGYPEQYVARADSRHEFTLPFTWGLFRVMPFVVGRLTGYEDGFDSFSSDSDEIRAFGAVGVRASTQFQRVDNSVRSRLFDLNRMRHIIEPGIMLWQGYSSIDETDLPVYDTEVESIGTASAARLSLRNTWQTQRGGPGRWRSVDWLVIDASVMVNSEDANRESPAPQFFLYRPEYSQFGDHATGSLKWLLSDTFILNGTVIADLEEHDLARGSVGTQIQHSPDFTTTLEYRFLDASGTKLLNIWWDYKITRVYAIGLSPQWDFTENKLRSIAVRLVRSFPDFDLRLEMRYDDIVNETRFAASMARVDF